MSIDGRNPAVDEDISHHLNADPALRDNMLEQGFVYWFMGKWFLTPAGKRAMQLRREYAIRARQMGLTVAQEEPADTEEKPVDLTGLN